jgi:hypothetical protein
VKVLSLLGEGPFAGLRDRVLGRSTVGFEQAEGVTHTPSRLTGDWPEHDPAVGAMRRRGCRGSGAARIKRISCRLRENPTELRRGHAGGETDAVHERVRAMWRDLPAQGIKGWWRRIGGRDPGGDADPSGVRRARKGPTTTR